MTKRVFVTANEVPDADYIIPGKEYEMIDPEWTHNSWWFGRINCEKTEANEEGTAFICSDSCPHLDGLAWTVRIED